MPSRRVLALVGCASIVVFFAAYAVSASRPGATTRDGYYGWADQSNYRSEARALADGVLPGIDYDYERNQPKPSYDPSRRPLYDYAYGLGYPVLGVPATLLGMRSDPFLVPDALLFAAEIAIVVVLGARLRSLTFGLLTAGALVFATPLLEYSVVPWSDTITTLAVLVALLVVTDPDDHPAGHAVALGGAIGICFAARYVDALLPATIGAVGLLLRRPRAVRALLGATFIAALFAIPVLWSQAVVFGSPLRTPYAHHVRAGSAASDQDLGAFDLGRVPRSFVEVFVRGEANGAPTPVAPMLVDFRWIVFAPVGLFALVRRNRSARRVYLAAAMASVAGTVFYLSFRASTGGDLVNHNLRYFVVWVPLWALLSAYGIADLAARIGARATGNAAPLSHPGTTVAP
jgi:hypothetical protein